MNKEFSLIADDKNSLIKTLDLKLEQMKEIVLHSQDEKQVQLKLVDEIDSKQERQFKDLKTHFEEIMEK